MSVTYEAVQWIRSAGQTAGKPPLVLRNPQNDNTKYDYLGCGPEALLAVGPNDYYVLYEGLTDQAGAQTNFIMLARGTSPWYLTKDAGPYLIAPNTGDWEQGEVCPTTLIRDEVEGIFKLYFHGGNNAGPRQVGLMTAPILADGTPGTFTRYGSNPIITVGAGGSWNSDDVADFCVLPREGADWLGFARGNDGSNIGRTGKWSSSDRGYTWTPYASNPVIDVTGGSNASKQATAPAGYIDELGRIHLWPVGINASDVIRVLYAYSDDDGDSFTFNPASVSLPPNPGGGGGDPDLMIGDVNALLFDEGLLILGTQDFNLSGYSGDALGRLSGRGHFWLPAEAAVQPARPGRCFVDKVAQSCVTVNAAAKLLNSSIFTIYAEIKVPPHNTFRHIYTEPYTAFNEEFNFRIDNAGKLAFFFRTPTGIADATSADRVDDGKIHRVRLIRRGAADFEMYIDGVSVGSSSVNAGTSATATLGIAWGNWYSGSIADEPLMGWIRQSLTIQGYALSTVEEAALWNGGKAGGVLPGGVTATNWVQHGSGGAAGPDAAYGGATYGTAVGAGTTVVNAAPNAVVEFPITGAFISSGAQLFAPSVVPEQPITGAHIASGALLFAPSVIAEQLITGAFIASSAQLFAPSVFAGSLAEELSLEVYLLPAAGLTIYSRPAES